MTRETRPARERGVTLIELLVVLMVISVLLGLGVGAFSGLHLSYQGDAAIERVKSCLRRTRNFAVAEGTTARVTFDKAAGTVTGAGLSCVALFHLEDDTGAYDRKLSLSGGSLVPDGRYGSGLRLAAGVEAGTEGRPSDADPSGVAAEIWVRPESASGGTLLSLGTSWRLSLGAGNILEAECDTAEGPISVAAPAASRLPIGRYSRVGFVYDRASLRLSIDGAEIASEPGTAPLRRDRSAPLRVGAAGEPFEGVVDEVKVHAVSGRETQKLPPDVAIASAPPFIQFDATGKLDPRVHGTGAAVEFALERGGGKTLLVSELGAVRIRETTGRGEGSTQASTGEKP